MVRYTTCTFMLQNKKIINRFIITSIVFTFMMFCSVFPTGNAQRLHHQPTMVQRTMWTCYAASARGQFRFTHLVRSAAEQHVLRHCRNNTPERFACHLAGCDEISH